MSTLLKTIPLAEPQSTLGSSADHIATGLPVPPLERLKLLSPQQWEDFVLEWAHSLGRAYARVDKCASAGDKGRDVVALTADTADAEWDNYQCKHYDHPLQPTDIWLEIGKLAFYTHRRDYTPPRRYYFVAPQGAGTKLLQVLREPAVLKEQFLANWNRRCRTSILKGTPIDLSLPLREHIESLTFAMFEAVPPMRLLDQHARTRWHAARFGGGLPPRPRVGEPPAAPTGEEAGYVRQLLDAYGDYLNRPVLSIEDAASQHAELQEHFADSRREFYSAEALRRFTRDTLPPGSFESLQDEFHSGIRDELRLPHPDGYRRVVAVTAVARTLQVSGHALALSLRVPDRGGICHQLANDDKVRWVR